MPVEMAPCHRGVSAFNSKRCEVRDVSLPSYAAADEIHIRAFQWCLGQLFGTSCGRRGPERAVALELSEKPVAPHKPAHRGLRTIGRSKPSDARLKLRFSGLLATETGTSSAASGSTFVAVLDRRACERSVGGILIDVAFDPKGGPAAIG